MEDNKTHDVELGFFKRSTAYGIHPAQIAAPREAHWLCQSRKEWSGTRLLFDLAEEKGQTLLRFTHANWQGETDYMVICTTTWGELMYRLKAAAEGNKPEPLFSKTALGYGPLAKGSQKTRRPSAAMKRSAGKKAQ